MRLIDRYLAGMFLRRLAVTALGLVALLGVLDALGNADLLPAGAGFADSLRYMALRVPVLFDRVGAFALLLAAALTCGAVARSSELAALGAAGLSAAGIAMALAPAVLLAGALAALAIDRAVPPAARALEDWLGAAALREDSRTPRSLWIAEDGVIVEIGTVAEDRAGRLTLFERGAGGRIAAVSTAEGARPVPGGWALTGVAQIRYDGQPAAPATHWMTGHTPGTLRLLMAEPRNLAAADLLRLARMEGSGNRPAGAYRVWMLDRAAIPVVWLGLLFLAVAALHRPGGRDRGYGAMAVLLAAGFAFLLGDGILKAFAERGAMDAGAAVAVPLGALYLAGGALLLWRTVRA